MTAQNPVILALAGDKADNRALQLALSLASEFDSSLEALLLEDPRLYAAAELPLTQELVLATASLRPLSAEQLEARAQRMLQRIEQQLSQQASAAGIRWQLRRQRQSDWLRLLPADIGGQFLVWRQSLLLLQPAPPPGLLTAWLGDPASQRALQAAMRLAKRLNWPLKVYRPAGVAAPSPGITETPGNEPGSRMQLLQSEQTDPSAFMTHLASQPGRAMLLPASLSPADQQSLEQLLRPFDGILVLVS